MAFASRPVSGPAAPFVRPRSGFPKTRPPCPAPSMAAARIVRGRFLPGAAPPAALSAAARGVRCHPDVANYFLDIVERTRRHDDIELGASPRASEHLLAQSRAHAALEGREFVIPDDVKRVAPYVLSHRLLLTSDAEIQDRRAAQVVLEILDQVKVPIAAR